MIDNHYIDWIFVCIFVVHNHLEMNKRYPTNLTDNQWQKWQEILEPTARRSSMS